MSCSYNHQFFESPRRVSQSLRNDRCQNILYKAVFEHFKEPHHIAALLLSSKSFQNSSFGANFLVNWAVDDDTIPLLESVLSPSSCFSVQFVPSLHIKQSKITFDLEESTNYSENIDRSIANFVGELVHTKYLHSSLRSLKLDSAADEVVSCFFGRRSNAWPQLQDLTLYNSGVNDTMLTKIFKNAVQLLAINLSKNPAITDAGLEHIVNLSCLTSLKLSHCNLITDAGLHLISTLPDITSLNLDGCAKITDAGMEHVVKLASITSLSLFYCSNITDAGMEHISQHSRITSLHLWGCDKVTDDAKQKIKTELPNCKIY